MDLRCILGELFVTSTARACLCPTMTQIRTIALSVSIFGVLIASHAFALNAARPLPQSGHTAWCIQDETLFVDRDGNLWIGTASGLEHWEAGHLSHFPDQLGFAFGEVTSIIRSSDGTLWIGIFRKNALGPALQCLDKNDGVPASGALELLEDKDHSFWIVDPLGSSIYHRDPVTHQALPGQVSVKRHICNLISSADGDLLAMAQGQSIAAGPER
jgi:ligand-binding sensor domain-containing protein